jgi:hypothetical protein
MYTNDVVFTLSATHRNASLVFTKTLRYFWNYQETVRQNLLIFTSQSEQSFRVGPYHNFFKSTTYFISYERPSFQVSIPAKLMPRIQNKVIGTFFNIS